MMEPTHNISIWPGLKKRDVASMLWAERRHAYKHGGLNHKSGNRRGGDATPNCPAWYRHWAGTNGGPAWNLKTLRNVSG